MTPFYNEGDDGDSLAKDGVSDAANLDRYTAQSIATLTDGSTVFAGQRDDGRRETKVVKIPPGIDSGATPNFSRTPS